MLISVIDKDGTIDRDVQASRACCMVKLEKIDRSFV